MTQTNELHVVLGASGGTGGAIVRELVSRGRRVRAVNRSGRAAVPAGVEVLKGDAANPDRMREVCRGATVVYNCVNPPFTRWTETFPPIMQAVIEGAAAAGAKLVFADDTWMYGKVDGPMTEDLPYRPVSNKGVLRAWLADMLLAAHDRGKVRDHRPCPGVVRTGRRVGTGPEPVRASAGRKESQVGRRPRRTADAAVHRGFRPQTGGFGRTRGSARGGVAYAYRRSHHQARVHPYDLRGG